MSSVLISASGVFVALAVVFAGRRYDRMSRHLDNFMYVLALVGIAFIGWVLFGLPATPDVAGGFLFLALAGSLLAAVGVELLDRRPLVRGRWSR